MPSAPTFTSAPPPGSPFLKWAGGKSGIAVTLAALLPQDTPERVYREPFLGGGALFFHLRPERAVLSDALADLITTYRMVERHVEPLIQRLDVLKRTHSPEQFYAIRTRFNEEPKAPPIERAAWLIYLNKTCFNGLFRTNRSGEFNVPIGNYKNPKIVDPERLRLSAVALSSATIEHASFEHLLEVAAPGDVIYLDPPYVPLSKTSHFSAYSDGGFGVEDQARLAAVYRKLDERGCLLALSNSDTPLVHELYAGFNFTGVEAPRAISAGAEGRGIVRELVVRNLARYPKI
jgi:DNA adenine methylase